MTAAAVGIAVVALILATAGLAQIAGLRRRVDAVPEDGGVFAALRGIDNELGRLGYTVADLAPRLAAIEQRVPLAISHSGVVAYDAFDNIAGHQSRSIALLNDRGDGIVFSLLVGRSETLFFTKEVRGGSGREPLSPEEQAAIRAAMAG